MLEIPSKYTLFLSLINNFQIFDLIRSMIKSKIMIDCRCPGSKLSSKPMQTKVKVVNNTAEFPGN